MKRHSHIIVLLCSIALIATCVTAQNCVSSFSTPLRLSFCNRNVGTVSFTVLSNGRLQVNVTFIAGISSPGFNLTIGSSTRQVQGLTFTTQDQVCGQTLRLAVSVRIVDVDGDACIAWAVPGSATLPSGVTFTRFRPTGFSGSFSISFCPCITSCCNPTGFKFNCNSLQRCPLSGPQDQCYCGDVAGGGVACLADAGTCTGLTECTSTGDCPKGFACQVNTCCSGKSFCIQLCGAKFAKAPQCDQPPSTVPCCDPSAPFDCQNLKFCPQSNPFGKKCYCGTLPGKKTACLADRGTCNGVKSCTKNGDCPAGSACQLDSCCGGNICVPLCQNFFGDAPTCPQPTLPPSCCNSNNFQFQCPSCTGKNCPPKGALSPCPRTNPFTDQNGRSCYCGKTAENGVTCFLDRGTCNDATPCTSSAKCPAGQACQAQSCCAGDSICVPLCPSPTECQNSP